LNNLYLEDKAALMLYKRSLLCAWNDGTGRWKALRFIDKGNCL